MGRQETAHIRILTENWLQRNALPCLCSMSYKRVVLIVFLFVWCMFGQVVCLMIFEMELHCRAIEKNTGVNITEILTLNFLYKGHCKMRFNEKLLCIVFNCI